MISDILGGIALFVSPVVVLYVAHGFGL